MPNKLLLPGKFVHHVPLFFSIRRLLSGCPQFYQNKLQEQGGHDVVNTTKVKFEPYDDLAYHVFLNLIRTQLKINKIKKHQELNISTEMIQKTQKQTELLPFLTFYRRYYQSKVKSSMWFISGLKII